MELSVFEKNSGFRITVMDSLYTVDCPKVEEVYVRKAILRLKEICDELPKYEGVDKNGIKLDKEIEVQTAKVSADFLQTAYRKNSAIAQDKIRRHRGKTYCIMAAASIVGQVLDCEEKSKDGYYYYCENAVEPISEEYFQGYYGVQLVDIRIVGEQASIYGPEYTYCYTFTKKGE